MPFADQYIDVAGLRTRYWQSGESGDAVILIHGIACSVEDWRDTIPALAQGYRVYALDLAGCGRSDKPADFDYSQDGLTRFVLHFMDAVGVEAAHVAGFSMGGRLALTCALAAPGRVRTITAVAPAGIGYRTISNFRIATLPLVGELLLKPNRPALRMLMRTAVHDPALVTDAMIAERLELARLPGAQSAFLKMLRAFVGFSGFHGDKVRALQEGLAAIACPILVVWGLQDKFLPVRQAEILREKLPGCRIELYDKCGHLPQIEQPEQFNADVASFLRNATQKG